MICVDVGICCVLNGSHCWVRRGKGRGVCVCGRSQKIDRKFTKQGGKTTSKKKTRRINIIIIMYIY